MYQKKALEIDPNSRLVDMGMGVVHAYRGEYEKAIQRVQRLTEEYPESATIRFWKSFVHLALNQPSLAVREAEKALSLEDSAFMKLNLAWICAETEDKVRARKILDEVTKRNLDEYVQPSVIGLVLLALGETDEGFRWFERAVAEKDSAILMMGSQPWYEKYRKLSGWKAIDGKIVIPR
jgi:tetratricopeptide (TPR) repeat protein